LFIKKEWVEHYIAFCTLPEPCVKLPCYSKVTDSLHHHQTQIIQSYMPQVVPMCTLIIGSLGPHKFSPNGISITSTIFAGFTHVTTETVVQLMLRQDTRIKMRCVPPYKDTDHKSSCLNFQLCHILWQITFSRSWLLWTA